MPAPLSTVDFSSNRFCDCHSKGRSMDRNSNSSCYCLRRKYYRQQSITSATITTIHIQLSELLLHPPPKNIVKTSFNLFMVYTMPKHCFWLRISDFRFGKDIIAVSVTGDVKDYVRSCNTSYDRYPTVCGHFDRSVNRIRIVSFNVVCNAFVLFFKAWFVE